MELDLEEIAILLQRRYNWLREVKRLTGEMQDSVSRHDEISFALLLQMRAEVLAKYDASGEELWSQAELGSNLTSSCLILESYSSSISVSVKWE